MGTGRLRSLGVLLCAIGMAGGASAADELAIRVPQGYRVARAAGAPLVNHPMMAAFDDRGRLYITESSGQNLHRKELEANPSHSIRMLEDLDGDGVFDRSTVFVDRLTFAQGAVWHDGWLYCAVSGGIWRFADRDGDGVAELRQRLVDGFGYTGNAADIHGCFVHPSGRIYWVGGRHGHRVVDPNGNVISQSKAGGVFSIWPDGRDFHRYATGGFDNPVELVFTPRGEVLGVVNLLHSNPRLDELVHWVEGGVYPREDQLKPVGPFTMTGDPLPGAISFGHVAVAGCTWVHEPVESDEGGKILVAFFNRHGVAEVKLKRKDSTFGGDFAEFLSCENPDFHPTDVLEDADGSVLVVDTGGWFSIGCPTSRLAKPDIPGAIYRIRRVGAKAPDDPRGLRIPWEGLRVRELIALLDDPRFCVRDRVITELGNRPGAIEQLRKVLAGPATLRARRNALWALCRHPDLRAREVNRSVFLSDQPELRQMAAHCAGVHRDRHAAAGLRGLLADSSPEVAREAASALALIIDPGSVPALLEGLSRARDRFHEHALIHALIQMDDVGATAVGLSDARPAVRRGAMLALDQMSSGAMTPRVVLAALRSGDGQLSRAALDVFARRPQWAPHAVLFLEQILTVQEPGVPPDAAPRLLESFIQEPPVQALVGRLLGRAEMPIALRVMLLGAAGASGLRPAPDEWVEPIGRQLRSGQASVVLAAIQATESLRIDRFDALMRELARDKRQPAQTRLAAVGSLAMRGQPLDEVALSLLTSELSAGRALERRRDAAQMLAAAALDEPQLLALTGNLSEAGPFELPLLLQCFEKGGSETSARAVVAALSRAPARWSLDPALVEKLADRYGHAAPPELRSFAHELREAAGARENRLKELEGSAGSGEPSRGRQLFTGKATCMVCHRIRGEGGLVGPDLSTIGAMRGPRDLIESIVFPGNTIAQGYETLTVPLKDGHMWVGRRLRETAQEYVLVDAQGIEHHLPIGQVQWSQIKRLETSLMPTGLDRLLSTQELGDLIAYLRSLK